MCYLYVSVVYKDVEVRDAALKVSHTMAFSTRHIYLDACRLSDYSC